MRFTLFDPKTGQKSLWECRADGTGLHRLRLSGQIQMQECCGEWTADGRYFLFTTIRENRTDVWAIREQGLLGQNPGFSELGAGTLTSFHSPNGRRASFCFSPVS